MKSSHFLTRRQVSFVLRLFWLLALALLVLQIVNVVQASPSLQEGADIKVTIFEDAKTSSDGECSLREAIIAANTDKPSGKKKHECAAGSGADTIILASGTYTLTRTDAGNEDASQTGDLDITDDLTIIVKDSDGVTAGATIIGDVGFQDRIIHILSGQVTISNVAITGGNVPGDGGGIYNSGTVTLTNVTVSGNTASASAGGIYNEGTLTLNNVTIADNVAVEGGGVVNAPVGLLEFRNTIIARNVPGDCSGTVNSLGYNLDFDGSCVNAGVNGDITSENLNLGPLWDNGGNTLTHELLDGSPAIDAANPAVPGSGDNACEATDQRGISRPGGPACDIGAYEVEDPPQTGPVVVVNTDQDVDDGFCGFAHCSLREAINAANANGDTHNEICFDIPVTDVLTPTIMLSSTLHALPTIIVPATINGTTQPGSNLVVVDGTDAGAGVSGLTITAGDTIVRGLMFIKFDGNGILLYGGDGNTIQGNIITGNGGAGVSIIDSVNNAILGNDIYGNWGLPIDLGGDGPTPNDPGDGDIGANYVQNYPVLFRAVPDTGSSTTLIEGRLNSIAGEIFTVEFFSSDTCSASGSGTQTYLGSDFVTTDEGVDKYFRATVDSAVPEGYFVLATATDPDGNTSEFSPCVAVGADNDSWPRALRLTFAGDPLTATADQYLDLPGQSRWYKFQVETNSTVIVTLSDLPANYDLTFYKDIAEAYQELTSEEDLVRLSAEFAPAAFSPAAFSPAAFSPAAFSPAAFSPAAFSPAAFSPAAFSPAAFSSAQSRSLIGVSAFEGTASEGLILKTWNNTGDFYIRVHGREGAFSLAALFHLEVQFLPGPCGSVSDDLPDNSLTGSAGDYTTLVLTDPDRMAGTAEEKSTLQSRLADFVARPEVNGVVVDVGDDVRVAAANAQADTLFECPYAKNLVAEAIKNIVDSYRESNPDTLEYIVIVGNDETIPFFRYADTALLGYESNFVPPVFDFTPSQASLRLGYVLSQDGYGAPFDISVNANAFPIMALAVGRLVETPTEVIGMLDAYLSTADGVVPAPQSTLVTGYDFLEDAARAIQAELEAGTGIPSDKLITPAEVSPQDPDDPDVGESVPDDPDDPFAWTADHLAALLLNNRYDLAFLAGHFSASGALAADYTTALFTTDLVASDVDMTNAIFWSAGCHSGYNIVNEHGIPGITLEPDWAQAFAQKGANLVGGTGYQYGDTQFLEYSERLYLEFSQQLRTGQGPVSIGKALVAAKQDYLGSTPFLRGIHEKALLEATIFGFPMLSVDMPGERILPTGDASIVEGTTPFTTDPGDTLGLEFADVSVTPSLETRTLDLKNVDNESIATATYLSGSDGVLTNPAEPTLPLEIRNVSVPGKVLRGVGFRGGSYTDILDVLPLTGAPTTEIRGVHSPFLSDVFFPIRTWIVNYLDVLFDVAEGVTRLAITPAQHRSTAPGSLTSTLRRFDSLGFRLYYSDNFAPAEDGTVPALSDAPTIVRVSGIPGDGFVDFEIKVVGNPAVGVQEVWVTYSALNGPFYGVWQSVDLTQNEDDSTLWEGTLSIGDTDPSHIRFIVQAFNGVGLGALATNLGAFYIPGVEAADAAFTQLSLEVPDPDEGPFGTQATFSAVLTDENEDPLEGKVISFGLGAEVRQGVTGSDGRATAAIPLIGVPDLYLVRASFAGTVEYAPSTDFDTFRIIKQDTALSLDPQDASGFSTDANLMVATLTDLADRRLPEQTVFFLVTGNGESYIVPIITDYAGRATLGNVPLPPGTYSVDVYFSGVIPLSSGGVTLENPNYNPATATGTLTLFNMPPICSLATSDPGIIWPPDKEFWPVKILNVTDPDGDDSSITIKILSIFQDEPVGKGKSAPDGRGIDTDTAEVRAERDGNGNGRVYHIEFEATDEQGAVCTGVVRTAIVSHDQGGDIDAIDEGPIYDSTKR
jgi:CSLREA domain-containing protein